MDVIDELLANNRAFADSVTQRPTAPRRGSRLRRGGVRPTPPAQQRALDIRPSRGLAVVTCMDSRLNVFEALGLSEGQAHVLRNAGGVITDDVIRSLAISQRRLGTRAVMLIHHTDCGMQTLTDDGFRAELREATGLSPSFAIESFSDLDADVRQSLLRVRRSSFVAHRDLVRGFVYDVGTHRLREVHADGA